MWFCVTDINILDIHVSTTAFGGRVSLLDGNYEKIGNNSFCCRVYNPADYENLKVDPELKELFTCITR